MSREKLYTFTVPVTIRAVKTVYVKAENQEEACDKFRDTDWYDCKTDEFEEEYEWMDAALDEVQELDEEEAA
jgi:hypothetical protein